VWFGLAKRVFTAGWLRPAAEKIDTPATVTQLKRKNTKNCDSENKSTGRKTARGTIIVQLLWPSTNSW
jgi:hypothetical protein